ncbi:uncharacterized protein LOC112460307 isoform X1 [Temnothorax curvispinosus]|uniref:Uncharacterized protein LOC112460307 isoform X1 n=1 Tax=Temnothorax curvispinosus TaxID=300111 RepID=A0A6J1QEG4_9HYME|nr:uncharacterized protein LOC112460307 isoform X1 [Temnothorax curvispinosus]
MVVTCAVPKCKSYKTKKKNVSMFKVPRDIEMRKKWKAAIPGVVAFKKTHTICEKHFEAHYIIRSYIKHDANGKVIANVPFQRPRLHSSAVPTIFDDNTSSIYNKVDKVPELVHPTESHQSIIGKKCDRFEAWSNALKTKKMTSYMRVCSRHFQKEDYILPDVVSKTRRLKTTAVPSCTLPSSATRKTPSVAEADEERLQKQIRRRMLKQMEQRMQVDRDTENNESTDPLKSVQLPPDVTTSEINTEMIHCHRIKEEPTDTNEGQMESYTEEGVCSENIEYCEDNKNFLFINVDKMKIETEEYKEEGACNETIEYCENNKDLVSINTVDNTVEKTEGHVKKDMHNQSIEHSNNKTKNLVDGTLNAGKNGKGSEAKKDKTQGNILTGRFPVNFSFMWSEIHRTFKEHTRVVDCQFKYWKLVNFTHRGLRTEFYFKCQRCLYEASVWSDPINFQGTYRPTAVRAMKS